MKKIKLKNNKQVLLDDEDYYRLFAYPWNINSGGYAVTTVTHKKIFGTTLMHRIIVNAPLDKVVDHINGNRLDNRKANLRIVTQIQNSYNTRVKNRSGYKGVSRRGGVWISRIYFQRKEILIGKFKDPIDAAKAYDERAKLLFGKFANLNFKETTIDKK